MSPATPNHRPTPTATFVAPFAVFVLSVCQLDWRRGGFDIVRSSNVKKRICGNKRKFSLRLLQQKKAKVAMSTVSLEDGAGTVAREGKWHIKRENTSPNHNTTLSPSYSPRLLDDVSSSIRSKLYMSEVLEMKALFLFSHTTATPRDQSNTSASSLRFSQSKAKRLLLFDVSKGHIIL